MWGERNLQEGEVRGEERGGGEGGNRQKGENLSKKREKSQRQKIVKTKKLPKGEKPSRKSYKKSETVKTVNQENRQQRKPSTAVPYSPLGSQAKDERRCWNVVVGAGEALQPRPTCNIVQRVAVRSLRR